MEGFSLSDDSPVAGRALVVHDEDGVRVACGILESTTGEVTTIGTYPSYTGDYAIVGTILVAPAANGISLRGTVAGLEASTSGGIHIHTGTTVVAASGVGAHYYPNEVVDPWLYTYWYSDATGAASIAFNVSNYTLSGSQPVAYRALVVHLSGGSRAGAGLVSTVAAADLASSYTPEPTMTPSVEPTSGPSPVPTTFSYTLRSKSSETTRPRSAVASFTPYPGYTGSLMINGTLVVQDTSSGINLFGTLYGLEENTKGGVHIHTGVTCASAGDHYYNSHVIDPWLNTM